MTSMPPSGLYAITSETLCRDEDRLLAAVDAALRGGLALLQYRDKFSPLARRAHLAQRLLKRCREAGVPLIINDSIELAATIGADGVHLGQGDGSPAQARDRLGSSAIVGVTCSGSLPRALAAESAGASYVAFGAFFPSTTKPEAKPVEIDLLRQARLALRLPICAIGGITPERAPSLLAAGASHLAVVEGVFGGADPELAVRAYGEAFRVQARASFPASGIA